MKKFFNSLIISVIIFSIAIVNPVSAFDKDFYSSNDILFYNSSDTGLNCSSMLNSNISYNASDAERQQAAAEYFSSTSFSYNNNKTMNAVQIAAILGNLQAESSINPISGVAENSSHKGIAQWSDGRWALIPETKTELLTQLNFIKTELDGNTYGKNVGNFWNITEYNELEEATFLIARNYEVAVKNGGGPTEWSNGLNPSEYLQGWKNRLSYAADLYEKFSDIAGGVSSCVGMSLDQAKAYANKYETSDGKSLYQRAKCDGYSSSEPNADSKNILANCVAVVVYFIQNNTTFENIGLPDGGGVVNTLLKAGFTDGGSIPQPYAVFSTYNRSGSSRGHTGLILGIDSDDVYVFEEGCGQKLSIDGDRWSGVKTYSLSEMSNGDFMYAYPPDGTLKNL